MVPFDENASSIEGIELDAPAHPFPERHDHRSARVRSLLCVMLRDSVRKPNGDIISPAQMAIEVLERGPDAMSRVCARVQNRNSAPLGSSPANRIFDVTREKRGQAKGWLLDLPSDKREEILSSHYISNDAWVALQKGDNTAFVEHRIQTLMELERKFMDEKGVSQPLSHETARSAIDVEDQVPLNDEFEFDEVEPLV